MPIADDELTKFIQFRFYQKPGGPIPSLACNGYGFESWAGDRYSPESPYFWPVGTLFVHHGCTLYEFSERNYQGEMHIFKGPLAIYDGPDFFYHCSVPCLASYIGECEMSMPDCVPSDVWTSVAYLDNSGSSIETEFTYTYTIGTVWSNEISKDFDIDVSVTEVLKRAFFKIFSDEVSSSFSTGYNWQSTSSQAKSDEISFTMETDVPAGTIVRIEQALGMCGASEVKTEMFRHTDLKTGKSHIIVA